MKTLRSLGAMIENAPWGAIIALLIFNLVLGIVLAPHYGQSTDEEANILFARATTQSYSHPDEPFVDPAREDKGPFYLMLWLKAGEFLGNTVPGWLFADGRHFVNFLSFQLAIVSIYILALRFVGPPMALGGVLLFESQPVFFGHAFINQKDTPFMAFFAAALTLGITLVDQFVRAWGNDQSGKKGESAKQTSSQEAFRRAWADAPAQARRAVALGATIALLVPAGWWLLGDLLRGGMEGVILDAYRGQSWPLVNELFSKLAENAATIGPEAYVLRAGRLMDMASAVISIVLLPVGIAVATYFWPASRRLFWPAVGREIQQGLTAPLPWMLGPAAIILGMTIAIRSMAMFAGFLVVVYALARAGPRISVLMGVYLLAAGFVAYALWPQLWDSPAGMIFASLDRSLGFPQPHRTLFEGVTLLSDNMPRRYLPEVIAIQFTLPALAFVTLGLGLAIRGLVRREIPSSLLLVMLLWAVVPFVAVVGLGVPIYNYFRHVLFMMPPLFVVAAIGLDRAWRLLRSRWMGILLVGLAVLPGLLGIVGLHPYEYGYFNEFVGGVRGAYGRFMSDYWCTSVREAMRFVNGYAPPSAGVAVTGPESNAIPFAREDLRVKDDSEMLTDEDFQPVVIVGCAWATMNPDFFPDAPVLWTVEREGVPLAVVKLLATPEP